MTGGKQLVSSEKIELYGILTRLKPLALGNSAARLKPFLVESETTAFHTSMRRCLKSMTPKNIRLFG
jgi:hypothetical protein